MLILAAFFGALSGFLGNYFSVELSYLFLNSSGGSALSFPTGPSVVIIASAICVLSLLFAHSVVY